MVEAMGRGELLKDFAIETIPEASFIDPWRRNVGGYTECAYHRMVVGTGATSFAHEVAHALQNCAARQPPQPGETIDHANWTNDGVYEFIERASLCF